MCLSEMCLCACLGACCRGSTEKAQLGLKLFCLTSGRALEDGKGSLADGTQFDRQSGEEHGPNGYWFRWHRLKGKSGKVSSSRAQTPHNQCTFTVFRIHQRSQRNIIHNMGNEWKTSTACSRRLVTHLCCEPISSKSPQHQGSSLGIRQNSSKTRF